VKIVEELVEIWPNEVCDRWDISERVISTLEKRFDQSTHLGVYHLIPMRLFQVLWQGPKVLELGSHTSLYNANDKINSIVY